MNVKPVWDPVHLEQVIPITCPNCKKCWLIVAGKKKGQCVHGGPYKGYVEVKELKK